MTDKQKKVLEEAKKIIGEISESQDVNVEIYPVFDNVQAEYAYMQHGFIECEPVGKEIKITIIRENKERRQSTANRTICSSSGWGNT